MKTIGDLFGKEIISKKADDEELALLCKKYSLILGSGISEGECTRIISKQYRGKKLQSVLINVCADTENGASLSEAFKKNNYGKIPELFYETIGAGEKSGNLSAVFEKLSEYFKNRSGIKKKIKSAFIYPIFVLCVAAAVIAVMMLYVVPRLTDIFTKMGGELPAITKALITASGFFADNILVISILCAAAAFAIAKYVKTPGGRLRFAKMRLRFPMLGRISLANNISIFARLLSLLDQSGITLNESLGIIAKAVGNRYFGETVLRLKIAVESGRPLALAMAQEEIFPQTLSDMSLIGQEAGRLGEIMESMSEYYREMAERLSMNMIAKTEPALMIVIAAVAAFIVFAIYIPMFEIYGLF